MASTKLKRSELGSPLRLRTDACHVLQLAPLEAVFIQVEDTHYHHDSAVLLPDLAPMDEDEWATPPDTRHGLEVLAFTLAYANIRTDERILVAGHTDRSGKTGYNVTLSAQRAKGFYHALLGEEDEWVLLAQSKNRTRDHKRILRYVAHWWGWPCDPGPIDDSPSQQTTEAIREFQNQANIEFDTSNPITGWVDRATWTGFFKVYMRVVRDLLRVDEGELQRLRSGLVFVDGHPHCGCGEHFPLVAADTDDMEIAANRRVEVVFFKEGNIPTFDCHPSPNQCLPGLCEAHNRLAYPRRRVAAPSYQLQPAALQLEYTEITGLHLPGHDEGVVETPKMFRVAGYKPGHSGNGRVYINHKPRSAPGESWQDARAKDVQYIDLTVEVKATNTKDRVPGGLRIVWSWEDVEDDSDEYMHTEAQKIIDPKDAQGIVGDDNTGKCDYPKKDAKDKPQCEGQPGYQLSPGTTPDTWETPVVNGVSKVRMHLTNVAGDSFIIAATIKGALSKGKAEARTGTITMWKRIDLEYRKMATADPVPVADIQQFYDYAFVQFDYTEELSPTAGRGEPFMSATQAEYSKTVRDYVKAVSQGGEFENGSKPGWFLLVAANRAVEEDAAGSTPPATLYSGTATIETHLYSNGVGEKVVIPQYIPENVVVVNGKPKKKESIKAVLLIRNKQEVLFPVWRVDRPWGNAQTILHLDSSDYQSDFTPGDGSVDHAYKHTVEYFPRHKLENWQWEPPGYGFSKVVDVRVPQFATEIGGTSPPKKTLRRDYFAGRTVVYTKHPRYTKANGISTIVHELCHAFGFPHKCGFYTHEQGLANGCAMNYFNTWLYKYGTREPEDFKTPPDSGHLCGKHIDGVRKVNMEENPAIWDWP